MVAQSPPLAVARDTLAVWSVTIESPQVKMTSSLHTQPEMSAQPVERAVPEIREVTAQTAQQVAPVAPVVRVALEAPVAKPTPED